MDELHVPVCPDESQSACLRDQPQGLSGTLVCCSKSAWQYTGLWHHRDPTVLLFTCTVFSIVKQFCDRLFIECMYHVTQMDPQLELYRRDLVLESGRKLDKARMIRFDERTGYFASTDLGRTASHYYIKYNTIEVRIWFSTLQDCFLEINQQVCVHLVRNASLLLPCSLIHICNLHFFYFPDVTQATSKDQKCSPITPCQCITTPWQPALTLVTTVYLLMLFVLLVVHNKFLLLGFMYV